MIQLMMKLSQHLQEMSDEAISLHQPTDKNFL